MLPLPGKAENRGRGTVTRTAHQTGGARPRSMALDIAGGRRQGGQEGEQRELQVL